MKVLIPIVIGLLVVGCGKDKQSTNTNEGNNTLENSAKKKVEKVTPSKGDDKNSTIAKPVKGLTLREKVVGTYESDGPKALVNAGKKIFEYRMDLLNDGTFVHYMDDEKTFEGRWEIKGNEIHQILEGGMVAIYRLNTDMSLTNAESLLDETLLKIPEDIQYTYTKIKPETKETPSKGDGKSWTKAESAKELTLKERAVLKERTVGTYEVIKDGDTCRVVLLANGVHEFYINGKKDEEGKWIISKYGELHIEDKDGVAILRINKNGSTTIIAGLPKGEKREYYSIKNQLTLKKIK